jgi:hypothetical protein
MIGGCLRRVVVLAVVVGGVVLAWQYRAPLRAAWVAFRDTELPARKQATAGPRGAEEKLASLQAGRVEVIALPEGEVQRLVESRAAELLPGYIVAPRIELRGGRLKVRFQVPTVRFPRVDELGEVLGFLPDTTEVVASGQLIPLRQLRVGVAIDELTAARIPLPRGMIPAILRRLGRQDEPGLPPDAFGLELPAGAANAYIRGDSLILTGPHAPRS